VEVDIQGFRHAVTILQSRSEWNELLAAAKSIGSADVVKKHVELNAAKKKSGAREIAGGQTALNALFRERLAPGRWVQEPELFSGKKLNGWKMDFRKKRIGVEVSFNHSEAIP
jgi:hypothetical protein